MTQTSASPSLQGSLAKPRALWRSVAQRLKSLMPKGLYARSLLIVIFPMLILQTVVTYVFLERHWQLVTRQLSTALVQDIAAVIDVHNSYPQDKNYDTLTRIAQERMNIDIEFMPKG
ncbi:MAG TPA: two-component sensor histidine kinase, partial [Methylovirgula sp.]